MQLGMVISEYAPVVADRKPQLPSSLHMNPTVFGQPELVGGARTKPEAHVTVPVAPTGLVVAAEL